MQGQDLNLRPPGYEPDELPAALPRDIVWNYNGAGNRGRTGTIGKDRRILSPVRLPIPPLRHKIGSEGGARTHSLPVNSRLLHHWATSEYLLHNNQYYQPQRY